MPIPGVLAPDLAAGFRFDLSAAIGLVVSAIVIGVFTRECLGRSRAAVMSALLVLAANAALGVAMAPVAIVATWQLIWFLPWILTLFFAEEDIQAWLGRQLVAGWIVDVLLISLMFAVGPAAPHDPTEAAGPLLWACALSLACRVGALPVGIHRLLSDRPPKPALAWMLFASLPPALILGMRMIDVAQLVPISRLNVSGFLLFLGVAAVMGSLHQEADVHELAWRVAGCLSGVAAVSLLVSPWAGQALWIVAALGMVFGVRRIPDWLPARVIPVHSATLLGRLEVMAADEWGLPRAWRLAVVMPIRGSAQVLRFVDGFVFEQLPAHALRRFRAATAPVAQAVPELFGRWLVPVLIWLAFMVLLALAFR